MKVQELRDKLKAPEKETLEILLVEMYKKFSRAKKEEEIDPLIEEVLAHPGVKAERKTEKPVNFPELKREIQEFIENAYAGYYFSPNRVIPKQQRPKWRFQVKRYVKELDKISAEDPDYRDSVSLLSMLYKLLCAACGVYLFSSVDPFRSVGISQIEFFEKVLARSFAAGFPEETIRDMLLLAATENVDSSTLHLELESCFVAALRTSDVKYAAIRIARELVAEKQAQRGQMKRYDSREYYVTSAINELCSVILIISIALGEPEKELPYFFRNHGGPSGTRKNRYGSFVHALRLADIFGDDSMWMLVYEGAVKAKIHPENELAAMYEEKKKRKSGTETGA